jgi:hypothetical protein
MITKLQKSIIDYSKKNGYKATSFVEVKCVCGNKLMQLFSDDEQGAAQYICSKCKNKIDVHDSMQYAETLEQNICNCEHGEFEIVEGLALYDGSNDPRWLYIGCSCPKCKLVGVYVDWQER